MVNAPYIAGSASIAHQAHDRYYFDTNPRDVADDEPHGDDVIPVSYTHLTLPTNREV